MSSDNVALVHRWMDEVWNKGRTAVIDELMSSRCVVHGLGEDQHGPGGFRPFFTAYRDAFPDLNVHIDDVLSQGDEVAVRWSGSATHLGNGLGFPATGRRATFTGMYFVRIDNGQFVEAWNNFDQLGML